MERTYQISEKEKEGYVLYRTDPEKEKKSLGVFATLGEAIELAEIDGKDLTA
jgi:hypothetical protein